MAEKFEKINTKKITRAVDPESYLRSIDCHQQYKGKYGGILPISKALKKPSKIYIESLITILGKKIFLARQCCNLTLEDADTLSKITRQKIRSIEHGDPNLDLETLYKLASCFMIDMKLFFTTYNDLIEIKRSMNSLVRRFPLSNIHEVKFNHAYYHIKEAKLKILAKICKEIVTANNPKKENIRSLIIGSAFGVYESCLFYSKNNSNNHISEKNIDAFFIGMHFGRITFINSFQQNQ
ncbi:helix-turn-helix domain-containing protein [Bacteroidota bacterium]